jgi:hypothetical protein
MARADPGTRPSSSDAATITSNRLIDRLCLAISLVRRGNRLDLWRFVPRWLAMRPWAPERARARRASGAPGCTIGIHGIGRVQGRVREGLGKRSIVAAARVTGPLN